MVNDIQRKPHFAGFQVHLVTDGVSSSKPLFRSTAISNLQAKGAVNIML
jgi:hypothetical protein